MPFFSSAFVVVRPKWCVVSRIVVDRIVLTERPALSYEKDRKLAAASRSTDQSTVIRWF